MMYSESETVELKKSFVPEIKKEIIAFANSFDGLIYVGIDDDGTVAGVENPDAVTLQISNICRDAIKPDVTMFIHYQQLWIEEKAVIQVQIQKGTARPYYLAEKGLKPSGVYVRQGTSSAPASDAAIRQMIKETDGDVFEDRRALEQALTFDYAGEEFKKRNLEFGDTQKKTLGLINRDGEYTNLGLLLSDQCPHIIKAAVFKGIGQEEFQDRKEFAGSLFQQLNSCYAYLDMWNFKAATIRGLYRIDNQNYPEPALREALLNAIIHRDYAINAPILISIYDDRVEMVSVGGLCNGLELQDVLSGLSVCRNLKLANVFYRLKLIEAYGTGLKKILNAYRPYPYPAELFATKNSFKVLLPNTNATRISMESKQDDNAVLACIRENGKISRAEIEAKTGLSRNTVIQNLRELKTRNRIRTEGAGKNTIYCLP